MIFGGNYHSTHMFFKNHTRFFEGKGVLFLNPSPTRFVTHFLQMMRTLCSKNAQMVTVNLQNFIALKLRMEEGTVAMIKYDQ